MGGLTDMFKKPEMPKVPETTRMPDTMDPTVRDAGLRRIKKEQMAGGRESTDLTGGTAPYSNSELGR